ncbi:MAG: IclR family transcriptional regulator [Candidatus Velthaea sp.]|jgi:DNA-binding IclR family transcriptional regulator
MAADVSVFGRTLRVIEAFGDDDLALSLAELAARTELPKSTVHRIAHGLVERGWLERTGEQFALGIRLFELGQRVQLQRFDLHEIAIPFMEDLYEATHEIVNLGVLDGKDVVYLAKIGGHRRVPISTRLGGRLPAHCTALGKAMLAFSSDEVRSSVGLAKLVAKTPHSITDPVALEAELFRIARDRTAVDNEELVPGVVCVAAPVFRDDVVLAAVSVTGPKARIDPHRVGAAVQTAARGISRRLSRPSDRGLARSD